MARDTAGFIAIDVGSTTVRALAAQLTPSGDLEVHAAGQAPSLGVQRGVVTNIDEASFAIRAALADAQLEGKARSAQVFASIGGKHIASLNHCREVGVSRNDRLIGEKDVQRAVDAARSISVTEGAEVIHAIPRTYRVDGYLCRRIPIAMRGPTVGAECHIVMADQAAAGAARKAVLMAGRELTGLVACNIASSQAVLTEQEKEEGVVLLDIGGGVTHISAFCHGVPVHTSALPVGGNQIINDVSVALNIPAHVAERLCTEQGTCSPEPISPADELTVRSFGPTGTRTLRRVYLRDVIRLRVEEMLRMAFVRARDSSPEMASPTMVVLTGGVANLRGVETLAKLSLETPSRTGRPVEGTLETNELSNPAFSTAIGMLRLASNPTNPAPSARRGIPIVGFRLFPQMAGLKAAGGIGETASRSGR